MSRQEEKGSNPIRVMPPLLPNVLLSGVYALVALVSLRLFATLNASVSPVWPPTGLAIALLMLRGRRLWPGVFLGAFVANWLTTGTLATSMAIATGNTLEALTGASLVLRFGAGLELFDRMRNLTVFVVFACFVAPLVSATVGATSLALAGLSSWPLYSAVWITWWLGDASGALVVAPLLLSIFHQPNPAPQRSLAEFVVWTGAMVASGVVLFATAAFSMIPTVALGFSIVPLIVWAALRFGSRGTTGASFLFSAFAVWGTLGRFGPFTSGDLNTALLSLQFSIMVLATTGLALAAVVHERLDAEEESRKAKAAERRFQTMVDSAPDAIVIADPQGTIIQVNSQTETMFGYTRGELLNLRVEELMPHRYRERHVGHRAGYHSAPRRRPMGTALELFGRRKDGAEFPIEISLSPLQTDAGIMVSSSIRDISERQRAQEERERLGRLSAIGQATSMIGHDLRNPLQTISNVVYLTLEKLGDGTRDMDSGDQQVRRYLREIGDQTVYMNKIVSDLQDYTRPLKPASIALNFIALVKDVMTSLPRRDDIEFSLKFDDDSITVVSDPLMLRRIFSNIFSNALDAMPKEGRLMIQCSGYKDGVKVNVADTGEGISPETLKSIFMPFFTTKPKGQGLGLPVAKRLVEALNGKISVESTPGRGTMFSVEIPSGKTGEDPKQKIESGILG